MQKNDAIDLLALGGKFVVEVSKLDTDSKENEKFNECAKKCCIQKITVDIYFSIPFYYIYFHAFGGDSINFYNMLGITSLSQSESKNFETFINDNGLVHLWHEDICY